MELIAMKWGRYHVLSCCTNIYLYLYPISDFRHTNGQTAYIWEMWNYCPDTNKMSVRPAKTQIILGIRPVWSESSLCAQWVAKDPSFLLADSEDSDQTGWMHTHFVGFVMSWLISLTNHRVYHNHQTATRPLYFINNLSRDMKKCTKWLCAQRRLIRVFAVCMKKAWVLSYPLSAQRRLWSDWAAAGRTVTLLVLSCRGSFDLEWCKAVAFWLCLNNVRPKNKYICVSGFSSEKTD